MVSRHIYQKDEHTLTWKTNDKKKDHTRKGSCGPRSLYIARVFRSSLKYCTTSREQSNARHFGTSPDGRAKFWNAVRSVRSIQNESGFSQNDFYFSRFLRSLDVLRLNFCFIAVFILTFANAQQHTVQDENGHVAVSVFCPGKTATVFFLQWSSQRHLGNRRSLVPQFCVSSKPCLYSTLRDVWRAQPCIPWSHDQGRGSPVALRSPYCILPTPCASMPSGLRREPI